VSDRSVHRGWRADFTLTKLTYDVETYESCDHRYNFTEHSFVDSVTLYFPSPPDGGVSLPS